MFSTDDTIVAVATPAGRGGVAMARLSGPAAVSIALGMAGRAAPLEPRRATRVRLRQLDVPDDALMTYFPAPASYTGEDVVEISAHGSPVIMAAIVAAATTAGARAARPGEFTLRAFLHDKLDLVQAEAVQALVDAVSPAQAQVATSHLDGGLSRVVTRIARALDELRLRLEASIDFPDEGYHFIDAGGAAAALRSVHEELERLCRGEGAARRLRDGHLVVVAGAPNVGKSSLFNAVVGTDRAIVTPVAGTTRDLVSEHLLLGGAHVRLVDSAGLRGADDDVERQGIARAMAAIAEADLVVVVLDRSRARDADDRLVLEHVADRPRVVVANKSDLPAVDDGADVDAAISARTGAGVDELVSMLATRLTALQPPDDVLVVNSRQRALLAMARDRLAEACAEIDAAGGRLPEEFLAADISRAQDALEELIGRRTSEDLLAEIFDRFCIGK
ncbi:MAG: tRNA uridine-5-carboxymethylaminomethyl(34) synthesis GTPase MnmE [Vicinamibacterales bacterium]